MRRRRIIVEFRTATGTKRLEGVNVRFNINKRMSAVMNSANIGICNLARADIEYLTTFSSQFIALEQRKRIRLFAGYDDDVPLIFDGDIVEALPTDPPDVWLETKALSGYYNNKTQTTKSYNGAIGIKNLCQDYAAVNGLGLNDESTGSRVLSGFEFTGDKYKVFSELNNIGDVTVWEEDGILNVIDKNAVRKTRDEIIISEESSAMIGIPHIDNIGAEVSMLFNNRVVLGGVARLETKRIPSASGRYMIYEYSHVGSLRETDFYTKLKMRRL